MLLNILDGTDPTTDKDSAPNISSAKAEKWALDGWLRSQTEMGLNRGPVLY